MPVKERTRGRVSRAPTKGRFIVRVDPGHKAFIVKLDKSVVTLQRIIAKPRGRDLATRVSVKAAIAALQTLRSIAAVASVGQCQIDRPYSQLQIVLRDDGEYLCCNHKSPHCLKR